ncbi:hypothetical protein EBX93_16895, partial [bacterium]|nr:hypothetical protein [bacterium]
QVDPSGISGSPTNPYKYAVNNPISAIDPSGLCPECPPDISGIPFTTGVGYVNSAGNVLASGDLSYDLITKLRKQLLESFRAGKNVREYMKQFQDITLLAESNGKTSYYTFQINRILANAAIAEKNLEASSVTSLVQDRAGVGALGNAGRTAFALVGVVSGAIDCYNFGSSLNNLNEKRDLYSGLQALHDGGMVFFDGLAYSPHPVLRGIGAVAGVVDTITNPDGPINAFQYLNNYESLDDDILPEDPERRRDFLRIRERRSCEEKLKQCLNIEQINPNDPNDIIGPTGFGPGNSIELSDMAYRVRFENKSNALAPAAEVFVTEVLDTDLDLSTFRFTGAGFGSQSVTFNTPLKSVYARVDDRANSGLFVDITGNLNTSTRTINWVFRSIDPTTLQVPADATIGFLPPNTTSPMGEGYLTYTVRPNANSANGTVIDALASIIFDGQQTIN